MLSAAPQATLVAILLALTLAASLRGSLGIPTPVAIYLPYLWALFLFFALAGAGWLTHAIWVLAALSFLALREYFTLVDLRIQDRWGMLAAYLAIPFMYYFIRTDWYGMFVISIPVYAFLVIPFAVTLGGREAEGSVMSIGALALGLFLLVYCLGHIGYLARFSVWTAAYVVLAVAVCDLFAYLLGSRDRPAPRGIALQLLAPTVPVVVGGLALIPWTGIPWGHTVVLGSGLPVLVAVGCHTMDHLEADLGIARSRLVPGRGQVINSLKSYVYVAPVAFHYLRFFLGELLT